MPEKLEAAYNRLQTLEIMPTVGNMETLLQSLYDIREVYQQLIKMEDKDGQETDSE